MAIQKITADVIANSAVTADSLADTTITAAKLHTTLDLTGKTVTVATASAGDNDTTVASTAFVSTAIANLADSAPSTLDTLNELAAALGDDANFSTTVTNSIATKAPLASPDFTGDVTFDTSTLVVDATNNRVGIGTASPNQLLHLNNSANTTDNAGIRIISGTAGLARIMLGDTGYGSRGRIVYDNSDDSLQLWGADSTTSAERMRIDSSGNVGIGVTSPSSYTFGDVAISGGTSAGLTLVSGTTGIGTLAFADGTSGNTAYRGYVQYSHVTDNLTIGTGGTPVATIDSSGNVGINTTTIPHGGVGYAKFAIDGTNANAAGPHVQYTTSTDNYPVLQQLNWSHDNISLNFDSYYDGQWRSSDAGSNFQIYKNADLFTIYYDSGIAPGSALSWNAGLTLNPSGKVGIGTTSNLSKLSISNNGAEGFEFEPGVTNFGVANTNYIASYDRSASTYRDISFDMGGVESSSIRFKGGSGNVGIGQPSPAAALDIKGDTTTYAGMAKIYLTDSNSNSESRNWSIGNGGSGFGHFTIGLSNAKDGDPQAAGTHTNPFVIDHTGNVGIGQSAPATKLHVYGTDPVIRVSDDGTSGFSTLELRQQNTTTEGSEIMYNSGTGHTHFNNVWSSGDLKFATNTGSFGTTGTNIRLTVKSDGEIEVGESNVSTDRIKFMGNTNISAPSTSNHDSGTRLSFYDTGTNEFYAQGIESNHMWFNADDGGSYKFYTRAVQKVHIDCSAPMPEFRVGPTASNAMRLGSVTAVFPYSGPTLIVATPGAALTVHNGTNSAGTWLNLHSSLSDYLRGTATFSTINTSQQANIIVYLNVATKVYMIRQSNWNSVSTTGWTQISNNSTVTSDNQTNNVYVRYLPAGTHSLDNDSALYFFEAPIGP